MKGDGAGTYRKNVAWRDVLALAKPGTTLLIRSRSHLGLFDDKY